MVKRKLAYVCDVCGLTERDFASKKNFFEHVKSSIHTNLQFKCDECDLEFQYMKGVQAHKSNYVVKDITSDIHGENLLKGVNHINTYNLSN